MQMQASVTSIDLRRKLAHLSVLRDKARDLYYEYERAEKSGICEYFDDKYKAYGLWESLQDDINEIYIEMYGGQDDDGV